MMSCGLWVKVRVSLRVLSTPESEFYGSSTLMFYLHVMICVWAVSRGQSDFYLWSTDASVTSLLRHIKPNNAQPLEHTHAHRQTYIHTYIHTYINTYIHTYIHTYIQIVIISTLAPHVPSYTHTHTHTHTHNHHMFTRSPVSSPSGQTCRRLLTDQLSKAGIKARTQPRLHPLPFSA